jgi:hypothetical protein
MPVLPATPPVLPATPVLPTTPVLPAMPVLPATPPVLPETPVLPTTPVLPATPPVLPATPPVLPASPGKLTSDGAMMSIPPGVLPVVLPAVLLVLSVAAVVGCLSPPAGILASTTSSVLLATDEMFFNCPSCGRDGTWESSEGPLQLQTDHVCDTKYPRFACSPFRLRVLLLCIPSMQG